MARVFITGSSDGLGLMAARLLIEQGHEVVDTGGMRVEVATPSRRRRGSGEPSPGTSRPSPGRGPLPTKSTSSVASTR